VIRIEHSLEISRPPEDVFAVLVDLDRLPDWQSSAIAASSDGPLELGSLVHEKRRFLGRELADELEVVAFDPPRRLTLRSQGGPVRLTIDHELEPNGGGTRLSVVASGKPGGMMKFAGPMIERTAREEIRSDFARLKELLET
jgi:carbon monoxide dehydrogenase subunit G